MMKSIKTLIVTTLILLTSNSIIADDNCQDVAKFPTIPLHCGCIIKNAITGCHISGFPIKDCSVPALQHLFRYETKKAISECTIVSSFPKQCPVEIPFYNKSCDQPYWYHTNT